MAQGPHIQSALAIDRGGRLAPSVLEVPSGAALNLRLTDLDSARHTVTLVVPARRAIALLPRGSAGISLPGLRAGTYPILVDGRRRGTILSGAQGGP